MKKIAISSIILGVASLVMALIGKLIIQDNIFGISPSGLCQGSLVFLLLSINLLMLDKKS